MTHYSEEDFKELLKTTLNALIIAQGPHCTDAELDALVECAVLLSVKAAGRVSELLDTPPAADGDNGDGDGGSRA